MMPTTRFRPAAALALLTAFAAATGPATLAQTATGQTGSSTTTARKPVTHRTTTGTHTTAGTHAASSAADNPPGVPKVVGTPKPLFALRYVDVITGTGPLAEPRKYFTVQYTGWLPDGTKFDSSYDHGSAITFPYGAHQVITGWDTGFEGMHVGGKRRLYIPYELAYGETGRPPVIPAKSNLIFDIELVSQSDAPPPRPEPSTPPRPATDPTRPANPGSTPPPPADPSKQPADPTKPTAIPPPTGSSSPSNPTAPPPTQSTTPGAHPSGTSPANGTNRTTP